MATTGEELILEQALERIQDGLKLQIELEGKFNHGVQWTKDYTEGYIDGLKRALELIPELMQEESL